MPTNTAHLATLGHVRKHLFVVGSEVMFVELSLVHAVGPVGPCIKGVFHIPTCATVYIVFRARPAYPLTQIQLRYY